MAGRLAQLKPSGSGRSLAADLQRRLGLWFLTRSRHFLRYNSKNLCFFLTLFYRIRSFVYLIQRILCLIFSVQSVSSNLARQSIDVGLRFLEEPSDTVVSFNKTAELYCRAQSSYDETITIGWLHNGKKLEDSSQMATNNQVLKASCSSLIQSFQFDITYSSIYIYIPI